MLGVDYLTSENRAEIRSFIESWTDYLAQARREDWLECWADDATLMPPGGPRIEGLKGLEGFAANFEMHGTYRFEDWCYAGSGDLAVVCNRIILEGEVKISAEDRLFDQIIVLRRISGDWKIQAVIFTATSL